MEWEDEQLVDEAVDANTDDEFDSLLNQTSNSDCKECINFYRARNK